MSLQVENLEKNMAKLTVEVSAEQFKDAMKASYNKNKGRFNIPGFRKGKATQAMVEKMYGPEVLYQDAADHAIDASYLAALEESGLDIVSRPEIEIVQLERDKPFIYAAKVAVKPEVTLGDYKGIEVARVSPEITEEDLEAELKKMQEQSSKLVNVEGRPVEDGDHTVIDFEGFVDGEAFEDGKAEDYSLVIGSHSFIDTFEEQLIGKNIGESCQVQVTFPEQYHAEKLKGKPAVFHVTIKEIKKKELPELNDEFADEVSEFDTLDELKDDLRAKLSDKKAKQAATENENNVVDQVVSNATMEIPDAMLEEQLRTMLNEYAGRMKNQGLSMEQYLQYTGMTVDHLKEQMKPQALKRIQTRLVLEQVVKQENIQVSDELVEEEMKRMAETYNMEVDRLKEVMGEREIARMREDFAVQEAVDFLVAEANLV